ncbi:translation initiation factor eIF-2B subunit epsilon [Cimex lectularius]|uniref:Translation initiation factor eIF2B subunit epsilon n=1 Tax=Cimex lectularius TaxID=79782 RepID=A0A8I6S026_CIMLE|nr:translation initiation factor eIF-2B subunit epsilon [Cimex lectularius]
MAKKAVKTVVDVQKESVVQAVIIADCYGNDFLPVTDVPCMMPLVNRPLLDYTLHCLSLAGVQETIMFCTLNTDQIKNFVKGKRWGRMVVNVIVSDGCYSFGDAMRDLDAKAVIRGDFVLLTGDVVGNLKLLPVIERHKQIQKLDKGASMTLIYKECGKKMRSENDQAFLAIDSNTDRILLHQRQTDLKKIGIGVEILLDQSDVDIRCDLLDTKISICSVTVPPLFSDNFDFQTRDDFVKGLLMNEEILASTVYSYILPNNEYAASVTSWPNYHYISHDVIHRWTFPLVPDCCIEDCYIYKRNNVYLQDKVTLAKNCHLVEDVVVGEGCVLNECAEIRTSVIGKRCQIGEKAVVTNSHLFSNVNVQESCEVDYCVLGEGCILRPGVIVKKCILGPGVILENGTTVENLRLQSTPSSGESYGPKAFVYKPEQESSDSDSDVPGDEWKGLFMKQITDVVSEEESLDSEDESEQGSVISDDTNRTNLFYSEVIDSLLRGFEEKVPCDNLVLEVNSSRYAYNVTVNEVNYYVVKAVLMIKDDFSWEMVASKLKYFTPLLVNYMRNENAMEDCLVAIEDVAEMYPELRSVVMKLIHLLYNKDILSEESVLKWYGNPRSGSESEMEVRKRVQPFVKWLEEAEMSDSDEE